MSSLARGPAQILLNSSVFQYAAIGAGVFFIVPDQVKANFETVIKQALLNIPSRPTLQRQSDQSLSNPPIVIHTTNDISSKGSSIFTTVFTYVAGAAVCWGAYVMVTNSLFIPEAIKEMFPVTRNFFESTSKALGMAVLNVKEVLEEKILGLSKKQDQLGEKQDDTQKNVLDLKGELSGARGDLSLLGNSLGRCESTLDSSKNMQSYTLNGVKLLVRCVGNVLPSTDDLLGELAQFIEDGEVLNASDESDSHDQRSIILSVDQRQSPSFNSQNNIISPSPSAPMEPLTGSSPTVSSSVTEARVINVETPATKKTSTFFNDFLGR
mmetsp:Transcript_60713/g.71039  ORF Transcript_60713/g.71039 Transcript_60713/m.71039 type:complete len:324 (+) Transcript_60713:69-1040(+)